METVKVTIEVPKPPDGYEVVGLLVPIPGDYIWLQSKWSLVGTNHCGVSTWLVARRKQTLAEWMNAQPDFLVVAKMFPSMSCGFYAEKWAHNRSWPKPPKPGEVMAVDGKWVDA